MILTSRNQDPIHASLALSSLLSVWYKPNSLNNKSIYNTLLLEFYICAKPRLTHWYPCPIKKCHYFCAGVYQILVTTNNYSDISGSLGCKITTDKRLIWGTLPRCSGDDEWSDLCPSLHVSGQYVHQLYHGGQWQHALVFLGYRVRWSPWWLWF